MRNVVPRGTDLRYGAVAVFVAALAVGLVLLVFPDTLFTAPAEDRTPLTWWMLALLFAVADACIPQIRVGRRSLPVWFGAAPLVAGLLLAGPAALLLGRGLGAFAVTAFRRREPPARIALRIALALAGTSIAALVVHATLAGADAAGPRGYAAAVGAAVLAAAFETFVPLQVQSWGERLPRGFRRELTVRACAIAAATGLIGVLPLLLLPADGQDVRVAALFAAAGLIGYRAFARLSHRHASLERLYVLSDSLAAAPKSVDVVRSVLQQSATLLRADYAEVLLGGVGPGVQLWSVRQGTTVYGPVEPGAHHLTLPFPPPSARVVRGGSKAEREFLLARSLREAVVVPIRIDGPVTGQLLVGDRVGEESGFAAPDLRLLETVANHAGVALRNSRLVEQLHFEARHDELTGLPNRLYFRGLLDQADGELNRGVPCAVMMLDFNGFKAINDSLGHAAGDQLLRELARRFRQAMGGRATVARLGGDEFAVLAAGVEGHTEAMALADRLMAAFDAPVELGASRLRVGGSLGIALGPAHARTGAELMRMADVAMYVAKSGTGGARVYSPELAPQSSEVLTLATDLREALEGGEIEILVQPLVRLDTAAVHSVEALARWRHPVLGEIAPGEFFAAAERSGLTAALSQRVLDQALSACRAWLDEGQELRVSVNMATRWLNNPTLPDQIARALERYRVPADLLCLEITESSVMDDPRRCLEVLTALRGMGVHLSVDDFGTGYSSLTYLGRLPVDQIKIDPSFTELVVSSDRERAIVASIIDLGRNLGMEVVAEGIGDAPTRRALTEMGCGLGQGYLFSRPIPAGELLPLIERIKNVGWPIVQRAATPPPSSRQRLGFTLPEVVPHADMVDGWQTQQPSRRI